MSGVFGFLTPHAPEDAEAHAGRMADVLSHRPWFTHAIFAAPSKRVSLGHIGIGIFHREEQPIASQDGRIWLVLSGEFYAAEDAGQHALKQGCRLRDDSDAELALRLYQLDGPDFVRRMDGVFAVAVWDSGRDWLVLASDRFGLRPVYYVAYSGCFAFAPEMKAILADPAFPRTLDHAAPAEYVRFQQVLADKTFFDGIRLLPPASVLRVRVASLAIELNTYWDWRTIRPIKANCSMVDIVEETDRLLRRSIEVRLGHTERPGAYLSGGLDSRALLAKDRRSGVAQGGVSGNWGDGRSAERRLYGEEAVTSGRLAPWRGKKFGD